MESAAIKYVSSRGSCVQGAPWGRGRAVASQGRGMERRGQSRRQIHGVRNRLYGMKERKRRRKPRFPVWWAGGCSGRKGLLWACLRDEGRGEGSPAVGCLSTPAFQEKGCAEDRGNTEVTGRYEDRAGTSSAGLSVWCDGKGSDTQSPSEGTGLGAFQAPAKSRLSEPWRCGEGEF